MKTRATFTILVTVEGDTMPTTHEIQQKLDLKNLGLEIIEVDAAWSAWIFGKEPCDRHRLAQNHL